MNIWLKTLIIGAAGAGGGVLGIFLLWLISIRIAPAYFDVGAIVFVLLWIPIGLLFCWFFSDLAGKFVDKYD